MIKQYLFTIIVLKNRGIYFQKVVAFPVCEEAMLRVCINNKYR